MLNTIDYCHKMGLKVTDKLLEKLRSEELSLYRGKGIIFKEVVSMSLIHQDYDKYGVRLRFDNLADIEAGIEQICNKIVVGFYEKMTEKSSSLLVFDGQVYVTNPKPDEIRAVMSFYNREFKYEDIEVNPRLRGKNNDIRR